jgi:hypothetical protein
MPCLYQFESGVRYDLELGLDQSNYVILRFANLNFVKLVYKVGSVYAHCY